MTLQKTNNRSYDRVQLIISTPHVKIVPTIELENVFEMTKDSPATKANDEFKISCKHRKVGKSKERRYEPAWTWAHWVKSMSRLS